MTATLILTFLVFLIMVVVGVLIARHHASAPPWLMILLVLSTLPAICYASYYLHLVDEPILLYRLRALPGSELLAAAIGLPTGWLGLRIGQHPRRVVRLSAIALVIAPMLLLIPYAKRLLSPLDHARLQERWIDGICQQSSSSTCGPSAAATVLRNLGLPGDEATLAQEAQTTASGTEIWFLARALRARGVDVSFIKVPPNPLSLPYPSIAGTRIGGAQGTGHFIAILGREGDQYVIGDPLGRRELVGAEALSAKRYFTGFFLLVEPHG